MYTKNIMSWLTHATVELRHDDLYMYVYIILTYMCNIEHESSAVLSYVMISQEELKYSNNIIMV